MPTMITLVDGTIPVAADFNTNYTNLNNAIGSSTSITSYTTGDTLYASATNTLSKLAIGATDNRPLVVVSGIPAWGTGQVSFPATQSASSDANTLDDYEEGSWTPVLTFATPGNLSVAYATQVGRYIKIGRMVVLSGQITTSTFTHTTASGDCNITGLPFASVSVTGFNAIGSLAWQGITKASYTDVVVRLLTGLSLLDLSISGSGQAQTTVTTSDMPTGGTVALGFTISYFASA